MLKNTLEQVRDAEQQAEKKIADAKKQAEELVKQAELDGSSQKAIAIAKAEADAGTEMAHAVQRGEQLIADAKQKDLKDIESLKTNARANEAEVMDLITSKIMGR